jgi:hypothetical protein
VFFNNVFLILGTMYSNNYTGYAGCIIPRKKCDIEAGTDP